MRVWHSAGVTNPSHKLLPSDFGAGAVRLILFLNLLRLLFRPCRPRFVSVLDVVIVDNLVHRDGDTFKAFGGGFVPECELCEVPGLRITFDKKVGGGCPLTNSKARFRTHE